MEGTARVFAQEYNGSTLSIQDSDSGNPAWVVTPGGAWCRSLFLSGALTEVTESGDMVYTRISDPTGTFDLVIGGRNTLLADICCKIPVPSFVTVSGRAQMYMKNGKANLSVRPDQLRIVNRGVRDQWVLTTAKATLDRLALISLALSDKRSDTALLAAIRHYSIDKTRLRDLAAMVENAVKTVRPPGHDAPAQSGARTLVRNILAAGNGPWGISLEEILRPAMESGLSREAVLAAVECLITEDECYQPRKGFVKLL